MNLLLTSAGCLAIMVALIHSIIGELVIFKKLRYNSLVPNSAAPPLQQRNIRILWATWHLASILGFAMGSILIYLATTSKPLDFIIQTIAYSMCLAGVFVLYATKAKHPGWLGLMGVALLCWLA